MSIKYTIDLPLVSPERTLHHRKIILKKKVQQKLYEQWYSQFSKEIETLPNDTCIELDSDGGFFKQLEPKAICTDILDLPTNAMIFSVVSMPFDDCSVGGIFMIDTFLHISDVGEFLFKVDRVIAKNGKLSMIKPANTFLKRFIYKNYYREPFVLNGSCCLPSVEPLSGANGGFPRIVFESGNLIFEKEISSVQVNSISFRNPFFYLLSGCISNKQPLPDFLYGVVCCLDKICPN